MVEGESDLESSPSKCAQMLSLNLVYNMGYNMGYISVILRTHKKEKIIM